MEAELIAPIQKTKYIIEFHTIPGRTIPTLKELQEILNENLEPHIEIGVRGYYHARKDC